MPDSDKTHPKQTPRPDTADIFNDILLLYELSLSIGTSLDLKENCHGFLSTLMARKNLAYAGVWIRNSHLPEASAPDGITLAYAQPPHHLNPPAVSPFELLAGKEYVAYKPDSTQHRDILKQHAVAYGACVLFPLGEFGVLKCCSPPHKASFSNKELNQLRSVIKKFAVSVQGSLSHLQAMHESRQRKQVEDRMRALIDNATDIICSVDLRSLQILSISPAVEAITGLPPEELTGKSVTDLRIVTPKSMRTILSIVRRLRSGILKVEGTEFEMLARDGSTRFVEGNVAVQTEDGTPAIMIAVLRDITRRKKRDAQMARLAASVEHAQDAIIISDLDSRMEYVNPAFENMTGYPAAEALGRYSKIMRSGEHPISFYVDMLETVQRGKVWRGEMSIRRKDGRLCQVERSVAPVFDANGHMLCQVNIQRDISEHRLLEEKLRQSQKMEALGTLVGGVAHEFNNTLAGMTGNLFLAKSMSAGNPQLETKLDTIEKLAFRGSEMIGQLLAFARKSPTRMKSFDLSAFFKESFKLHQVTIPESIRIETRFSNASMPVMGDANLLQQMLMNLLNNARDALSGQSEPHIRLSLEVCTAHADVLPTITPGQSVAAAHLCIEDNGCGIEAQHIEQIFEPFFTTKDVGKGTGLGLAMVYGTVQQHGGNILVSSRPGEGTSMDVYLPLHTDGKIAAESTGNTSVKHGKGELILLADDEPALREATQQILQSLGYRVMAAENGRQALDIYIRHSQEIALLLLDVVMPDMGGVELIRNIRAAGGRKEIILMTGYNPNEVVPESDFFDIPVLSKPMDFTHMSTLIHALLHAGTAPET